MINLTMIDDAGKKIFVSIDDERIEWIEDHSESVKNYNTTIHFYSGDWIKVIETTDEIEKAK